MTMVVDRERVEEAVVMFGKTKLPEYRVHNQAPQICMGYMTKLPEYGVHNQTQQIWNTSMTNMEYVVLFSTEPNTNLGNKYVVEMSKVQIFLLRV
jgi:hypothetical protein